MSILITGGVVLSGVSFSVPSEPVTSAWPWLQVVFDIYPIDIGTLNSKELAQTIVFGDD